MKQHLWGRLKQAIKSCKRLLYVWITTPFAPPKVIVLLVQESIYICNLGSKEEERKKEILVMSEAIDEEDADAGECQNYDLVIFWTKYFQFKKNQYVNGRDKNFSKNVRLQRRRSTSEVDCRPLEKLSLISIDHEKHSLFDVDN